jgi:hypothetical protein
MYEYIIYHGAMASLQEPVDLRNVWLQERKNDLSREKSLKSYLDMQMSQAKLKEQSLRRECETLAHSLDHEIHTHSTNENSHLFNQYNTRLTGVAEELQTMIVSQFDLKYKLARAKRELAL